MRYIIVDAISIVQFVQGAIRDRRGGVHACLEGNGIKDMEQYQHCMGELNALSAIEQELSDLLEKQEQII